MHGSHERPLRTDRFGHRGNARSLHLSYIYHEKAQARDILDQVLQETGMRYAGTAAAAFGSKGRRSRSRQPH